MKWLTPAVVRAVAQLCAALVALLLALGVVRPDVGEQVLLAIRPFESSLSVPAQASPVP